MLLAASKHPAMISIDSAEMTETGVKIGKTCLISSNISDKHHGCAKIMTTCVICHTCPLLDMGKAQ